MLKKDSSFILLETCVVIFTITTFSTITGQFNLTNFTLPIRKVKGYKNFTLSRRSFENSSNRWLFKDYIRKFNPNVVFNRIQTRKKAIGQNASVDEDFNELFEGMDATDDLLRLKVESISGRRKWRPPGDLDTEAPRKKDLFSLRQRFYELMRHTIYRTRNKLVIMQLLRTKYRNSSLYKMGFLMSKTDIACKSFSAYTFRAIHACMGRRYDYHDRHEVISLLTAEERMVHKWFEIELLIDLIVRNDNLAKETIAKNVKGRKEKWKFVD